MLPWILGAAGVATLFWIDANVIGIGLDRVNPLTPSQAERDKQAAAFLLASLSAQPAPGTPSASGLSVGDSVRINLVSLTPDGKGFAVPPFQLTEQIQPRTINTSADGIVEVRVDGLNPNPGEFLGTPIAVRALDGTRRLMTTSFTGATGSVAGAPGVTVNIPLSMIVGKGGIV